MEGSRAQEELLEALWYLEESESNTLKDYSEEIGFERNSPEFADLIKEGLVEISGTSVSLTEKGSSRARRLIRSHRIAERLVHDVLGAEFEQGACEFEHIVNPDLVDSICTLLGHPRECPHGMPIPEGQCCKQQTQSVESSVIPLDRLGVGETARIAYVYAPNDLQLHRLDNLLVRPGVEVRMHQRRPSFVIECEDTVIALDERVAATIHVWVGSRPKRRARHGSRHGDNR